MGYATDMLLGSPNLGELSVDEIIKANTSAATSAVQEAARELRPEDLKAYKNPDGGSGYSLPPEHQNSIAFWEKVKASPDYAKALYSAHNDMTKGALSGKPLAVYVKQPDGSTAQVQVGANGSVDIMGRSAADNTAMQNQVVVGDQRRTTETLLTEFQKVITATTSAVDRAKIKADSADAALLASLAQTNSTLSDVYGGQAAVQNALVTAKIQAGEAEANNAEKRIAALSSAPGLENVKKIFADTTQRHIDLMAKEDKAQKHLDAILDNPFYTAASHIFGGPDKNPVVVGASATLTQLAGARKDAQNTANQVLLGMSEMQRIVEKQFTVATPTEIRVAAAEKAAVFSANAAKARIAQAELPSELAKVTAKLAESGFKDTIAIAQLSLNANQALLNAATGNEKLLLTEENLRLKKYIADQADDTKNNIAEMKLALGADTNATIDIAKKYYALRNNTSEVPSFKDAAATLNQGIKLKDPDLVAIKNWSSSTTPNAVAKWRDMANAAAVRGGVIRAFPEATLAVVSTENGYSKWMGVAQAQEQVVQEYIKSRLDKGNEKSDRPIAEAAAQKMLIDSQRKPEAPLVAVIGGKDVKTNAPSPWKVYPGAFLSASAENNSGLSAELKAELAKNPIAKAVSDMENRYAMLPKSGSGRRTVGFEDVLTAALELKTSDPTVTTQQAMQWVSDIYRSGVELNNKYMAPEVFGLPKQESYVVEIQKEGVGSSVLRRATGAASLAFGVMSGLPQPIVAGIEDVKTGGSSTRDLDFRKNFKDAFTGIYTTEKVDVLKTNDLVMMVMRSNPTLWADKK